MGLIDDIITAQEASHLEVAGPIEVMHPCDNCGHKWPSKLAAAECCDPAWERGED